MIFFGQYNGDIFIVDFFSFVKSQEHQIFKIFGRHSASISVLYLVHVRKTTFTKHGGEGENQKQSTLFL